MLEVVIVTTPDTVFFNVIVLNRAAAKFFILSLCWKGENLIPVLEYKHFVGELKHTTAEFWLFKFVLL